MAWDLPSTPTAGTTVATVANWATPTINCLRYLYGSDGEIVLVDYPDFPSTAQGDIFYHDGTKLARLAAGTSGQYLQTLGAAANPAWATGTSNLTMVTTIDKSCTADGSWRDIDVSALVPAGTRAVQVIFATVTGSGGTTVSIGARKNGSTDTAVWVLDTSYTSGIGAAIWTEVDGSRIFEGYISGSRGAIWVNAYVT